MLKHATASTFVFHRFADQWRLGLIMHPRLGRHMIVGGHVERDETQAEAAVREAREESGLSVRLLGCPTPALPAGYPHPLVATPWWITEVLVPADGHHPEPHVHVDHLYLAIADTPTPLTEPAHPFGWFAEDDLDGLSMFTDTRLLAHMLFPLIGSFAPAGASGSGQAIGILSDRRTTLATDGSLTVPTSLLTALCTLRIRYPEDEA